MNCLSLKDKQLKNEVIFELTPSAQLLDLGTERLTDRAIWAATILADNPDMTSKDLF